MHKPTANVPPPGPRSTDPTESQPAAPAELAEEDFYFDGPWLVFTAAYHRKRGFCCNSGCRHCPFASAP